MSATAADLRPATAARDARRRSLSSALAPVVLHRLAPLAGLAVGLGLWVASLGAIDVTSLGFDGLLGEFPVTWWLALGFVVAGLAVSCWGPQSSPWVVAAHVGALVLVLFGTVPAVADVPQYAWTYKHLGVANLIEAQGGLDPSADIYNRWPASFALAAAFSRVAGVDVLSWAAWCEPLFMAFDALLVAALARTLRCSGRTAGTAAGVFVLFGWVGQAYFAPQALAMTFALTILLVVLRAQPRLRLVPWADRLARAAGGREPIASPTPVASLAGGWIAAVVALDVVLVATHQLTPYVVLLQIAALAVVGAVRPWWLVAVMGGVTVTFLLANMAYLQEHFQLFSGLNPFSNVQNAQLDELDPVAARDWAANAARALGVGMWAGAILAAWRLARVGAARLGAVLLVLAFSPFALVLGQSYGGEATLRLVLFSAPWAAIAIAAALTTISRPPVRLAAAAAVLAGCAALFVPSFFGSSQTTVVSRDEVRAAQAFYEQAPSGSVLMLAGPGFPLRMGARYPEFAGPVSDAEPALLRLERFRGRPLGAADLPAVRREIENWSPDGFLAFSATQTRYAETYGTTPRGSLDRLEAAVVASGDFQPFYTGPDARIYRLKRR